MNYMQFYRKKIVTIINQDLILRKVSIPIITLNIFILEFHADIEKRSANQAYQKLINDLEKIRF